MKLELKEFLKYRKDFSLGFLTTESFHPLSKNLSNEVNTDLKKAIQTLKSIDEEALTKLKSYSQSIYKLQVKCQKTIRANNKVFLSGCGATGRLALSMEKLFREKFNSDQVVGFMAGGDMALIKAVESFEDNIEYGERQLKDLGFGEDDLLLAITEGGETSFVIGTCQYAASFCYTKPTFIYCNPNTELNKIERSKKIIKNSNINKLNLSIGPMAISGSTRMQATTAQMLAVGFCLLYNHVTYADFQKDFDEFIDELFKIDYSALEPYISSEAEIYQNGGIVHYESSENIALAVLTDTTERSPTFNLIPYESVGTKELALSYLSVGDGSDDKHAWEKLLGRVPRPIEWEHLEGRLSLDKIYDFDISQNSLKRRKKLNKDIHVFKIIENKKSINFSFDSHSTKFPIPTNDLFFKHMSLKLLLNTHSTLIMGKMNRYAGNMMTYVRASNMKLIDRAIRYIEVQLKDAGIEVEDAKVAELVFENLDYKDGPIVTKVFDQLKKIKN